MLVINHIYYLKLYISSFNQILNLYPFIRPPGHTGKAKKGHICFDGGYETMNLGRVDFITNQEYDLFIRPDTANPRARYDFSIFTTGKLFSGIEQVQVMILLVLSRPSI